MVQKRPELGSPSPPACSASFCFPDPWGPTVTDGVRTELEGMSDGPLVATKPSHSLWPEIRAPWAADDSRSQLWSPG